MSLPTTSHKHCAHDIQSLPPDSNCPKLPEVRRPTFHSSTLSLSGAMKQLTVLVPNETGVAAAVAGVLAQRGVNIEEFDIEGVENLGVIVLTVDKYDEALRALRDHGFRAITQDTLLVRLVDKPGALAAAA